MAALPVHMSHVSRWLLPVLVALLVLGHACELPAYAELVSHHGAVPHESAPVDHGDGDDHALMCDATIVTTAHNPVKSGPVLALTVLAPRISSVVLDAPARPLRTAKVATGPPLFLLLSSLLI